MSATRKKTFPAIARLSRAARAIMAEAFLEGPGVRSAQSIVEQIKAQTGEKIDDNALYRYREYWLAVERPFIEARKEADGMLAALNANPTADVEELVKQRLTVAQLLTAKRFDESDPVELGYLAQGEKRIEVQRERNQLLKERTKNDKEKIALLERTVVLKEAALRAAQEKAQGAAKTIEAIGRKKGLDAETLKRIREEVYGIVDAAGS